MSKNPMLYKSLVIGVIILFCGMSVVSSTGNELKDNHSYLTYHIEELSSRGDNDTTPPVTWHILCPSEPDGKNGWYIAIPDITICAEDIESGVKVIFVSIDGGTEYAFPGGNPGNCIGDFVFTEDYSRLNMGYFAKDNAGNTAPYKSFTIYIDEYKPSINVDWDVKIKGLSWFVRFICEAKDGQSGMDRVEMYINNELQLTVNSSGPLYEFIIRYSGILTNSTFKFVAYDKAGHSAFTLVNGSDIKSNAQFESGSYQNSEYLWFLRLIDRFPFLEVFLRIINL